jgi:hypothetical protein
MRATGAFVPWSGKDGRKGQKIIGKEAGGHVVGVSKNQ